MTACIQHLTVGHPSSLLEYDLMTFAAVEAPESVILNNLLMRGWGDWL